MGCNESQQDLGGKDASNSMTLYYVNIFGLIDESTDYQ
jgi:hypothetical protein